MSKKLMPAVSAMAIVFAALAPAHAFESALDIRAFNPQPEPPEISKGTSIPTSSLPILRQSRDTIQPPDPIRPELPGILVQQKN